jgi:hypothetical protein
MLLESPDKQAKKKKKKKKKKSKSRSTIIQKTYIGLKVEGCEQISSG